MPDAQKPAVDMDQLRMLPPSGVRDLLGDGNFAGLYQRSDSDMLAIWRVALDETRALLAEGW
jgi:creatinine amidohydrolase